MKRTRGNKSCWMNIKWTGVLFSSKNSMTRSTHTRIFIENVVQLGDSFYSHQKEGLWWKYQVTSPYICGRCGDSEVHLSFTTRSSLTLQRNEKVVSLTVVVGFSLDICINILLVTLLKFLPLLLEFKEKRYISFLFDYSASSDIISMFNCQRLYWFN